MSDLSDWKPFPTGIEMPEPIRGFDYYLTEQGEKALADAKAQHLWEGHNEHWVTPGGTLVLQDSGGLTYEFSSSAWALVVSESADR